jgi:hypothetical protein
MNKFVSPNFENGDLEIRFENDTVCIYGTTVGLERLAEMCYKLIKKGKEDHIHLEDYALLTEKSVPTVIAIFRKNLK